MVKDFLKNRSFIISLALITANIAVFYQVHSFDFINYDDPHYVYNNPNVQGGLTLKSIEWAFTTNQASNWHPLTWISHILDWQLFGSNPAGHHIVNLIFHIANTLLLFIVLNQMTGAIWPSAFTAALFAIHPLHIESVAWVSERKDVLSTFFWILTMWAYVRFVRRPKAGSYLLVVVFFIMGLLSKPMLVTLPFVLLLLDYWPLERIGPKRGKGSLKYSLSYLIVEKVPLFAIAIASSIITFVIQRQYGAMQAGEKYSFLVRIANALISYIRYIMKMFWPDRLSFFYPHPGAKVSILYAVISGVLLLTVTIVILRYAKSRRYLVTGWLWYILTLFPVIGIVQVGGQAMADRYSYITLTGLFIIISWGLPELFGKWEYRKTVMWTLSLMVLSALGVCAYFQTGYWKDTITLSQHAIDVTKDNYTAHFCMALKLYEQGRIEESIRHNKEVLRIKPDFVKAINSIGLALYKGGRIDEAIVYYERALERTPDLVEAHYNLGVAMAAKGRISEAVEHYKITAEITNIPSIRIELGNLLSSQNRYSEAVTEYRKVLLAMPDNPNVLNRLGYALARSGKFNEAISNYNKALQISPNSTEIHLNLGFALTSSGRPAEAVKEYEKIILTEPQNAIAHNDLGIALFRLGKTDEAVEHFKRAIQINPDFAKARNNLNSVLAERQKFPDKGTEATKK